MPPVSTNPSDWFLLDRENPHTTISVMTRNNLVRPLIDGENYMKEIHDLINATNVGDYVFYSGWALASDVRMIGGKPDSEVYIVFNAARKRGVNIRVLLSGHITNPNFPIIKAFFFLPKVPAKIEYVLDTRVPSIGTHHQKFATVYKGGVLNAFCGGIELFYDRWDTTTHSSSHDRQPVAFPGGWHDVHCHIQGPACRDLDTTFRERWNDETRSNASQGRDPIFPPPPPIRTPLPLSATPDSGSHFVQVLRTYACNWAYPFAPRGEFSARRACLKAISLAKNYIYIEDQYFYSYEIAKALSAALRAQSQLRVIVVVPVEASDDVYPQADNFHQHKLITELRNAFPTRFAIYHLLNLAPPHLPVYVHAKLMIIDDVWAEIGSMNCNRRSMTHDSEVAVAVIDSELEDGVCKFARDLRRDLWSEHLRVSLSDLDPISGYDLWRDLAGKPGTLATAHAAAEPRVDMRLRWVHIDPQGTCSDSTPIPPLTFL